MAAGGQSSHPLKIFDAAKQNDKFVYALAPMVRYGKLAFRQTVQKYGTDICWTPMMLAKEFNRSAMGRDSDMTISLNNPQPTIVQFGASKPEEFARASSLAIPFAHGVDLNCGCPQSWACAESLGAALMGKREIVKEMVVMARDRLRNDGWAVGMEKDIESDKGRSVSVKIRIHDDLRKTMDFLDTVIGHPQNRQVDWITIHPRTRKTPSSIPIRTEALEILTAKYAGTLPILLSGDVFDTSSLPFQSTVPAVNEPTITLNDILPRDVSQTHAGARSVPAPSNTNLSGFMSARGLLANPALFAGYTACPWDALETFLCKVARAPLPYKLVAYHVHEMVSPGMGKDKNALMSKEERGLLGRKTNMLELIDFVDGVAEKKIGRPLRRDL